MEGASGATRSVHIADLIAETSKLKVWSYKISRADVADVFVQALTHPRTRRTTFEVVWAKGADRKARDEFFGQLKPDPYACEARRGGLCGPSSGWSHARLIAAPRGRKKEHHEENRR